MSGCLRAGCAALALRLQPVHFLQQFKVDLQQQ
jgi:hypothetical protein